MPLGHQTPERNSLTMNTTFEHNPYDLARMGGCASPDSDSSPGAQFLTLVAESLAEAIDYADGTTIDPSDVAHETADGCIPVYTNELWATFVDLAAWTVDTSDLGTPPDMETGARWALYTIAETVCYELIAETDED